MKNTRSATYGRIGLRRLGACFGIAAWAFAACTQPIDLEDAPPPPGDDDTAPVDVAWPDAEIPSNAEAPEITITSPRDGAVVDDSRVTIEGTASDDNGLASVFVQIGYNAPVPARSRDGFRTWSIEGAVPYGAFDVRAWAFDVDGKRSEQDAVVHLDRPTNASDSAAPTVSISEPLDGSRPLHPVIVMRGSTQDDVGVVRMELKINGVTQTERTFETDDQFKNWSRVVTLTPGIENHIVVRAFDAKDNTGNASIRVNARAEDDREPPSLRIHSPSDGESVETGMLAITGRARDNLGVREVKARVSARTGDTCGDDWSAYTQAQTQDGFENFAIELPILRGDICVDVAAIDVSGLRTRERLMLTNTFVPDWSEERTYLVRLHPLESKPVVNLELTRAGLLDVMSEEIQKDLLVAELDLEPVLYSALERIKGACGECWKGNVSGCASNHYDCSLTELGCSFGTGSNCAGWQNSPEYAMVRLLTLTPHNGNIEGSSLGQLKKVVDDMKRYSFGLLDSFADILAASLNIGIHDPFVTTDAVVKALQQDLIATHPSFVKRGNDYLLPVRLYDALRDLEPLGDVLGPAANGHPGVADPSFPTFGVVFPEDEFRMILVAESNLKWHDGIELGGGKNYISTIYDNVGPTYNDVMEFDFYDNARFRIEGLPEEPTVDMRFSLYETPRNIPVCSGNGCKNHGPTTPRAGYAWALNPWDLEHVLVNSAYHSYAAPPLHTYTEYNALINLSKVFVGNAGGRKNNPAGWLEMEVNPLATLLTGNPPPPQFLWEAIMDIAEVVAHRNVRPNRPTPRCPNLGGGEDQYTICEGDFNPQFTLYNVPTGVTAETLAEASRDQLHAQRDILTRRLWGGFEENNGCVDFYYVRDGGKNMLWETSPNDPTPNGCTIEDRGGFFTDEGLTQAVSSKSISGVEDDTHHKWEATPGEHTLFKRGNDGRVWRLRVHVPQEAATREEITVITAHKL